MPSHPSRNDVSWVSNPGHIGHVGSFAVSAHRDRVFLHTANERQLVCVIPRHLGLSDASIAKLAHLACQGSAKLSSSRISPRAYLKLVSSRHPAAPMGAKVKPDLPLDDKQIEVLSHNGARCDSETSSRAGIDVLLKAAHAPLATASVFVPEGFKDDATVLASAVQVVLSEIVASVPSEKHDRAAAHRAALEQHLHMVR
jgi:hypothetical protein